LTVLPLIFPNGHLLGPRWRWALWFALVAPLISIVFIIANTEPFGPAHASNNPAAYFAAVGPRGLIGYGVLWIASFISVSSLVLRYRGAGVEERQQVKWVVYALVLIALGAVVGMTPFALGQLVFLGTALFAAIAIAMAILRYRLYEIDVIINRTLVYGALSAILAGIYTASITLSQRLFVSTTGERSDAAIVFTTLVVVSFFTPVKGRLQSVVDARVRPAAKTPARTASSPEPVPAPLALDLLGRLAGLYASGAITSAEFEAKKTELLARV
jgi:hypothetical protein